jgi:hypothetical protein
MRSLATSRSGGRGPGAGEERLAATKHDGAEVESILIDKPNVAQASRQVWSGNLNLSNEPGLQPAYHRLESEDELCHATESPPQVL